MEKEIFYIFYRNKPYLCSDVKTSEYLFVITDIFFNKITKVEVNKT